MAQLKEQFDKIDLSHCTICNHMYNCMISAKICYIIKANGIDSYVNTFRPYCSIECMNKDSRLDHDEGEIICEHYNSDDTGIYYCWQNQLPFRIHGSDCDIRFIACQRCVIFEKCKGHPDKDTVYMDHTYCGKCIH